MKLADLQRDFRDWLTGGSMEASMHFGPQARRGLEVYQNNYRSQLVGVLQTSYPHLLTWLGSERFLQAAAIHIDSHPPQSWTLDAYGDDFADTLRAMLPHNPDAHELAWIEWSLAQSFVAADAGALAGEELANVDWETARLQLAPSLRQHRATTNAAALWGALDQGDAVPESEMLPSPCGLITWRQGYRCRLKQIDAIEHTALLLLHDDDRFSALCDALVEHLGEEAGVARGGQLLAEWMAAGIVTGIISTRSM
jgi:hypothetical protein